MTIRRPPTIVIEDEDGGTFSVYDTQTGDLIEIDGVEVSERPACEALDIAAKLDELGPSVWRRLN